MPPEPLGDRVDLAASIPTSGTAIDIACGLGAQSLWLAARGLRVIALDVSPVAIERVRAAADAAGFTDHVDARVVDLDDGIPEGTPSADVIVCQRFRHPQLYPSIIEHLAPGGIAIVTVLSEVGLSDVGLSQPPGPFHAPAGELVTAFSCRRDRDPLRLRGRRHGDDHGAATRLKPIQPPCNRISRKLSSSVDPGLVVARKSSNTSQNSSGASTCGKCPTPSMISNRLVGMSSCAV